MERNFKIGDKVKIRQWDEMVKEFGYSNLTKTSINCNYSFTQEMKYLCGKEIEIKSILKSNTIQDINAFTISFDMLEFVNKKIKKEVVPMNKPSFKPSFLMPEDVKAVFFNDNNVTVELKDGRKGTATCQPTDNFDPYPGFCMAYFKAKFTSNFKLKKAFDNCISSAKKKGYKTAILLNR